MYTRPTLAVDLDETIMWFLPYLLPALNNIFEKEVKIGDFSEYKWWVPFEVSKETMYRCAGELFSEEERFYDSNLDALDYFFNYRGAMPGAWEALEELDEFYEIHIVTNKPEICFAEPFFLSCQLFSERRDDVIIPFEHFHYVDKLRGRKKSDICKQIGAEIIIDDDPEVALDCAQKEIRVIVPQRPWNKSLEERVSIKRARNWQHILNLVLKGKARSLEQFGYVHNAEYIDVGI